MRQSNPLFLPSLTPQRREFFSQDVIFLEDLPATSLGTRFPELLKEYVRDLGGGLVVIAGPRFGLRELSQTPIADMLPVVIDPQARPRTDRPFALRRTALAAEEPYHAIERKSAGERTRVEQPRRALRGTSRWPTCASRRGCSPSIRRTCAATAARINR